MVPVPENKRPHSSPNPIRFVLVLTACICPLLAASQDAPRATPAVPATLNVPAGTLIVIRSDELLSSNRSQPGDSFTAVLEQPLVADGWVVSRQGQIVVGRIAAAKKAGRVKGTSSLTVELAELVLVDGQQVPIRTELLERSGPTTRSRDAESIGTTTGTGAAIGAVAGGGRGAAIGAAIGAATGTGGVLVTRGRPTEIFPETLLTFRLESPLMISTERGQQAFRTVTQADYEGSILRHRALSSATPPYSAPPPYYCRGCYYPPLGVEVYETYPIGPRFYGRPYFGRRCYWH